MATVATARRQVESAGLALRDRNARMIALLGELAQGEGFSQSRLPGVRFMRTTRHIPRSPITYEPSIVIIAQGRKVGHLGGRRFNYDPNHFLVMSLPLPFECETFGTPEKPLLGVKVGVTPALVTELLLAMQSAPPLHPRQSEAIRSARLDPALAGATVRLLECLRTDDEARILGPQIVREIIYRVLLGELGGTLRALAAPDSALGQISRVLRRIHAEFAGGFDMRTLAREAGMSVSTFHARFKAVTSTSPLQYLKSIRLHKARLLMVHDGASASAAAAQVGYESASQFSREFKRLFGDTPAAVAQSLRATLTRFE